MTKGDNTVLNRAVQPGGDVIATDELPGGEKVQRVKIMLGADGKNDGDIYARNRLPVAPDQHVYELLGQILTTLKLIEMHLAEGSNLEITEEDVDDDRD